MTDPTPEHQVSRKVVVEEVNTSGRGNSAAAWIIIAVIAIALIAFILTKIM